MTIIGPNVEPSPYLGRKFNVVIQDVTFWWIQDGFETLLDLCGDEESSVPRAHVHCCLLPRLSRFFPPSLTDLVAIDLLGFSQLRQDTLNPLTFIVII